MLGTYWEMQYMVSWLFKKYVDALLSVVNQHSKEVKTLKSYHERHVCILNLTFNWNVSTRFVFKWFYISHVILYN